MTTLGIVTGVAFEAQLLREGRALIRCAGLRQRAAHAAAESLVNSGATALMSFGIAGGLDPALGPGTLIVAGEASWVAALREHFPAALARTLAPTAVILAAPADKAALFAATASAAADMESAGVAEVAAARGLPFVAVRVIADTAHDRVPSVAINAATADGRVRMAASIAGALRHPSQIPDLIRLGRQTAQATAVLRRLAESDALYSAA